jgi:hypothetical protein
VMTTVTQLPHSTESSDSQQEISPEVLFLPASPLKLVVMSLCTFGLYELYWFYMNWNLLKQRHNSDISPFWRAFFAIFFAIASSRNSIQLCSAVHFAERA